jgi:hypothetical protein
VVGTFTVIAWAFSSGSTRRTQGGDFYLATSGDLDRATNGDFFMAMDKEKGKLRGSKTKTVERKPADPDSWPGHEQDHRDHHDCESETGEE